MSRENSRFSFLYLFLDFGLLNLAFFTMNYIKRDTLELSGPYPSLLLEFYVVWLLVALFTGKFYVNENWGFFETILAYFKSSLYMAFILSGMVILMQWYAYSRLQIFGTCVLLTDFEVVLFSVYCFFIRKKKGVRQDESADTTAKPPIFSMPLFLIDLGIITSSVFLINFLKRGSFDLSPEYEKILVLIYGLWWASAAVTRKFYWRSYRNIYYALAPCVKSAVLMSAFMALILYSFQMFSYSRAQIFGTFLSTLILESAFYYLYFKFGRRQKSYGVLVPAKQARIYIKEPEPIFGDNDEKGYRMKVANPVGERLKRHYFQRRPQILEFIKNSVPLALIDQCEAIILNSHPSAKIVDAPNGALKLVLNLNRVNHIRRINRYFLEVHARLDQGGYFIGRLETLAQYRKRFFDKYPSPFRMLVYYFDATMNRVLPKLPEIKKIYFTVTGGKNRVISQAEILGRLFYCGFRLVAVQEIGGCLYFVAQKATKPSRDPHPSYGPIVKLKRIGLDGRIIHIAKMRTMHPYSEYLQDYVFDHNHLNSNGKFKGDFRISGWGHFFRRWWIDELPQLINFFQGDLRLFGVRALSQHYFSLYPSDLQELRVKFKPGLIPPYYADLPESFQEIIESERQYLLQKQQHPFMTDVRYFSKAVYNIVVKKARSS